MFERILFPTDGSEGAGVALDHVLDLAAGHDASLRILHVADTTVESVVRIEGDVVDTLELEGEEIVAEAADRARDRGVDVVTDVLQGEPYREIVEYADTREIDLVAMPTHGRRGLDRLLLGSTTERVLRRSDVPVLAIRPDGDAPEYPYRDILVPTDGSDCADAALDFGLDLASAEGAAVHLLSVVDLASLGVDVRSDLQIESLEETASAILDRAVQETESAGIEDVTRGVEYGPSIHRAILAHLEDHDVDLIVSGTHGRTGFDRYLLGSVTEYLVRTSPVPVLAVREPTDGE